MLVIDQEVTDTIEDFNRRAATDESYQRLREFYDEMKRSGVALSQTYDLPPVDTIGTTAYRNRSQR
jgi:hypothetical protein